jgi:hypothetical protein
MMLIQRVYARPAATPATAERISPGYRLGAQNEFKENEVSELEHVLHAQLPEPAGADGLGARVDALIESHRTKALHSTTSTTECIGELVRRNEGLEQAVRALALALENLAAPDR